MATALKRTPSQLGRMKRAKGRRFEQDICRRIEQAIPGTEAHRSMQSDRAYNADIVVTGHALLERLWIECQDSRKPNPMAKLLQAERDIAAIRHAGAVPMPVVVWHRLGERQTQVTMRISTLDRLRIRAPVNGDLLVTMRVEEFLELLV